MKSGALNMDIRHLFLKLAILTAAWTGCSSDALQETSNTRSGSDENTPTSEDVQKKDPPENGETGTDVPADVTALFMTLDCKSLGAEENLGQYELSCRVADNSGKFIEPAQFAESYKWQVVGDGLSESNVLISESKDDLGYNVNISIGKNNYVKASVLSALNIKIDYVEKISKKAGSLSKQLSTIYAGLSNQKYMRFTIFSIKDHLNTEPIQFLEKISVKVDGQWLDLTMNETTGELRLGTMVVRSNGTITDAAIFMNILGKNNPVLPAALLTRFSGNENFDASEPLHLSFGNGHPTSVTGLRYNDGLPIASRNIAAGFPDDFQFETSPDNIDWQPVKDSRIKIDTINSQDNLDFVWNGSELN